MHYTRGDLATMASANALFMADLSDDDRLAKIAGIVAAGADVDGVISALSGVTGEMLPVTGLPSFAVVLHEGGHLVRLLVRGRLVVELAHSDGRVEQVQGDRARTWREELVDDVSRIAVYDDENAQPAASASKGLRSKQSWPLGDGMVWASRVDWELHMPVASVRDPASKDTSEAAAPNHTSAPTATSTLTSASTPPPPAEEPAPIQPAALEKSLSSQFLLGLRGQSASGEQLSDVSRTNADPGVPASDLDQTQVPPPDGDLQVSDALPSGNLDQAEEGGLPGAAMLQAVPEGWLAGSFVGPHSPSPAERLGQFAAPTQHATQEQERTAPKSAVAEAADEPDLTLTRRRPPVGTASTPASPAAGKLWAVECLAGHVSPANVASCRVCGQPVPAQQPFAVAKPRLGRLEIAGMPEIPLDRSVIIGRAPTADQAKLRPVVIDNADVRLSRSHLLVKVDDWQVSAIDLGSGNGSVVLLPTGKRVELKPHAAMIIEPSSVIILADVLTVAFEVP